MAGRTRGEEPRAANLTPGQMRQGISRIGMRIKDIEGFDPKKINERWAPETQALQTSIEETLSRVFGHGTVEFNRYSSASDLDNGPVIMGSGPDMPWEVQGWLDEGKKRSIALLAQAVKGLEEDLAMGGETDAPAPARKEASEPEPIIFVVHGHDEPAKIEVARLIERAGLNAVILHEQPNSGRTIIEKFEHHGGAAGFAVAILTPDDVGGPDVDHLQPRARQNVIGELFWFAGKLGRPRVCALRKGTVEIPSDFAGVTYTDMDDRGAWKAELLRELSAAGYSVDWAKAMA
jgi:predicted nucleotide-binding protein